MTCRPKDIIKTSALRERLRYRDGDTDDIVSVIMDMDSGSDKYIDAEAAKCLVGRDDYETLRNVWKFVKHNVWYVEDKKGKEVVKSPAALFTLGKGDCKSFSISEVAILRALGFKGIRYRFCAYKGSKDVTHVYVVCKLRGTDVILDAVYDYFDREANYSWKKDIAAKRSISGIGSTQSAYTSRSQFNIPIALGLIVWGATKLRL